MDEEVSTQKTWRYELFDIFDHLDNVDLRKDFEDKYAIELANDEVLKFVSDIYHSLSRETVSNISFFVASSFKGFYIQDKHNKFVFCIQTVNHSDNVVTGFYNSNRYSSDMNKDIFNTIIAVTNKQYKEE